MSTPIALSSPIPHPGKPEQSRVVLVVEDDEDDIYFFKHACTQQKVEHLFRFVRTGEEALKYLAGDPPYGDRENFPLPVLLVTDLKLPWIDGFDLMGLVRQHPDFHGLPMIVLSASHLAWRDRGWHGG